METREKKPTVEPIETDENLVGRCQGGDRTAREQLASRCLPRVRKTVLLTTGRVQDMDDIVQTALLDIFRGLASFAGRASFATWVDRVTVNAVRRYYRRRPWHWLLPLDTHEQPEPESKAPGPDRTAEGQSMLTKLASHLRSIAPKKRIALVLHAAHGYSVQEIALLTDCSADTVKKRLQHGRRELLAKLARDERLGSALKEWW